MRLEGNEPLLNEVFNRLRGELRMHGFETVYSSEAAVPSQAEFRRVAELSQADAVVALERLESEPTCHIWFVDRESGHDRVMSIAAPETEEAPTLLALRSVEILRSGLRERALPAPPGNPPSSPRAGAMAATSRPAAAAPDTNPTNATSGRLRLQLSAGLAWLIADHPAALMLMPAIGYRITEHFELVSRLALQLQESRIETLRANGEVRSNIALFESRWLPAIPIPHLGLVPSVGLGMARVSALGVARRDSAIRGQSASAWTMTAAAGLGGWIQLNGRWRFGMMGEVGMFLPKPLVRLDGVELAMGRPWFDVSAGISFSLL